MNKRERKNLKRREIRDGTVKHGWYSPEGASRFGDCLYLKKDGTEVTITLVNKSKHHNSGWADIKYVGKVTKCLRGNSRIRERMTIWPDMYYKLVFPSLILTAC